MDNEHKISIIKNRLDDLTDDGMTYNMDYWNGYRDALKDVLEMVFDQSVLVLEEP